MTWPTTAARGDEDNFFAFSVGLGWVGMGWRRGHGVLPKESVRVVFIFMIHIHNICLSWWPSSVCHNLVWKFS